MSFAFLGSYGHPSRQRTGDGLGIVPWASQTSEFRLERSGGNPQKRAARDSGDRSAPGANPQSASGARDPGRRALPRDTAIELGEVMGLLPGRLIFQVAAKGEVRAWEGDVVPRNVLRAKQLHLQALRTRGKLRYR